VAAPAIQIKLDAKSKRFLKGLEEGSQRAKVFSSLVRVMGRRGLFIAGNISKNLLSGQRLARRTGSLARSITAEAELIGGLPGVRVGVFRGPALQYAGVQEFGTQGKNPESPIPTIKPKQAKALAMPVGEALTPAGVPRYQSPRQFPESLRFVPFRSRNVIGALYPESEIEAAEKAARASGGKVSLENAEAAYLLLRELDLEPKEFLQDGMLNGLPALASDVGDDIVRQMREAG